ncbi:MAG: tRNA (adenine(22)-N(1))-methyltransferase [Candidatus Weimeria sp.]
MNVNLSKRLKAAYDMVSEGSVVADIGCDHAFLSIALVSTGRASQAFACDVNRGPLEKAGKNIEAAGLSEKIHTVLSDGLLSLDEPVDSIVICGMGGSLIISILSSSLEKIKAARELILSPQSDIAKVRIWLKDHNFSLIKEKAVTDAGKYYCVMKVVPSGSPSGWAAPGIPEEAFYYVMKYGPYLIAHLDSVFKENLLKKEKEIRRILQQLDKTNPRYKELDEELKWVIIFMRDK